MVASRKHIFIVALWAGFLPLACSAPGDLPDLLTDTPDAGAKPALVPERPGLFSHHHGFYTEPFDLVLTSPVEQAEIRYTLDGRDPLGDQAATYTKPLRVKSTTVVRVALMLAGKPALESTTRTYLFAENIPQQEASAEYPAEWWVDHPTGPYRADYTIDDEIVSDPRYRDSLPAAIQALPVISVAMDPAELFGANGIHENVMQRGVAWERAASAEIFNHAGKKTVQVNCGIRIHGAGSRFPERSPKKSFRLLFKKEYGPGKLEYPIFDDSPVQRFDTLVLRSRYNRSWLHHQASQRNRAQYVRERFAGDTQRAMGHLAPRGRHIHLFLNGLYWGVYLLQERPDASFQAAHLGGLEEEYDAINAGDPVDGDRLAWDELMGQAEAGLESAEAYDQIKAMLDIDNFIDYMLLSLVLGNVDWPDRNWYAARHRSETGKFRFFNWDAELTLRSESDNFVGVDDPDSPGRLLQKLRGNPEFRARFAERAVMHLTGDGALTPAAMIARWTKIADIVDGAVVAESARWGDHYRDSRDDPEGQLYTYHDHWLPERERIIERYFPARPGIAIEQFVAAGLYPAPAE